MRLGVVSCVVLLCALPADGNNATLLPPVSQIQVLAQIDAAPTEAALYDAFGSPPMEQSNALLAIARDPAIDLGIALRAIRALPAYCPAPGACGSGTAVHDTLLSLVDGYQSSPHTPQDLLRLRAAVEALGSIRPGLDGDVDTLLSLLGNASRDVRVTVVRALGHMCNTRARAPLRTFSSSERIRQVQLAIAAALQDLDGCAN